MTNQLAALGPLAAILGHGRGLDQWSLLNPTLQDNLYCVYRSSTTLRTVFGKLAHEVLNGGAEARFVSSGPTAGSKTGSDHNGGPPSHGNHPNTKRPNGGGGGQGANMGGREQEALKEMLRRALLYGLLYGLVPVAQDPDAPLGMRVPPIESGSFVARMSQRGQIQVGWQWNEHRLNSAGPGPAPDAWVFVWEGRYPVVGSGAPFGSVIQPLLPELVREQEMIQADTQAHYELSYPPWVLQENPRRADGHHAADQGRLELLISDRINVPGGGLPGHGPGGTLTGEQAALLRRDQGGHERARRSAERAALIGRVEGQRIHMDPCTGRVMPVYRTLAYQRAPYEAPAGWATTAAFARPELRTDLLAQRQYVAETVASALGVPPVLAYGTGDMARGTRTRIGTSTANKPAEPSAAADKLREAVTAARAELSVFYGQAHYAAVWNRESVALSREVAMAEAMVAAEGEAGAQTMMRYLELLGEQLASVYYGNLERRITETEELSRAADVADMASKLWRADLMQQHVDAVLGVVAGVRDGTRGSPGDMSLEALSARAREGEGLAPADRRDLRDPDDDGDIFAPPTADKKRKRTGKDPNALAETVEDRRERVAAEGRRVAGSTLVPVGDESGRSGYQRRALTEEGPDLVSVLHRAEALVDQRRRSFEAVEHKRQQLIPIHGDRGEAKVELVWLAPPVPDLNVLRDLAMEDVIDVRVYQRMVLSHLGMDPATAAARGGPEPLARAKDSAYELRPEPKGPKGPAATGGGGGAKKAKTAKQSKAKRTKTK